MQSEHSKATSSKTETASETVDRRKILIVTMCTLSSVIAGAMASAAGTYLMRGESSEQKENEWSDAGDLPDLRPATPEHITFERSRIDGWKARKQKDSVWLVLNHDGTLTAFSPLCTHLGCAYQWSTEQQQFACPCHGSAFGLNGAVLSGPALHPLVRLSTKVEGARLWLGPAQPPQLS